MQRLSWFMGGLAGVAVGFFDLPMLAKIPIAFVAGASVGLLARALGNT